MSTGGTEAAGHARRDEMRSVLPEKFELRGAVEAVAKRCVKEGNQPGGDGPSVKTLSTVEQCVGTTAVELAPDSANAKHANLAGGTETIRHAGFLSTLSITSEAEPELEDLLEEALAHAADDEERQYKKGPPEPPGEEDDAFEDMFAEVFGASREEAAAPQPRDTAKRKPVPRDHGDEAPGKRPRSDAHAASFRGASTYPASSAKGEHRLVTREEQKADAERPPPPERVAAAYGLLQVPLSASVRDVERKFRTLARHAHPDKVEIFQRARAARDFRAMQDAKAIVVAWLRGHPVGEDSDGSGIFASDDDDDDEEALPPDVAHATTLGGDAAAGGVNADNVESGSESEEKDERHMEMKVAEVRKFRWYEAEPASEGSGDSDSSDARRVRRERLGCEALALAPDERGRISTADNPMEQAMALSRYAGAAGTKRHCVECFDREAQSGRDVCRQCRLDEIRLLRELDGKHERRRR